MSRWLQGFERLPLPGRGSLAPLACGKVPAADGRLPRAGCARVRPLARARLVSVGRGRAVVVCAQALPVLSAWLRAARLPAAQACR